MKSSNKIVALFAVATVLSTVTATASANSIKGDGHLVTQVNAVQPFNSIAIKSWANVVVHQGDKNQVVISADQNLLPYMKIDVRNHSLSISEHKNINLNPSQAMNIIVTTTSKNLTEISTVGKIKLNANNINSNDLKVNIAGENDITLSGNITQAKMRLAGKSRIDLYDDSAKRLRFFMTGKSNINLCGSANSLILNSAGKSSIHAEKLTVNDLMVHGAGDMTISSHVLDSIHVDAVGKVLVNYLGNPKTIDKTAFGNVLIQKINK